MKGDESDAARDDGDLRALFGARRALDAAHPVPSFDAIVERARSARPGRHARSAWALAALAAIVTGALLIESAPPTAPAPPRVALLAARMPTDALLADVQTPLAANAWSTLPTSALGPAPAGASAFRTR